MSKPNLEIKLAFIVGLRKIVLNEVGQYQNIHIAKEEGGFIYLDFQPDLSLFTCFGSILRVYVIAQDLKYTPRYISNHKSILYHLIALIIEDGKNTFETFKINCAGSDSPEVRSIAKYIQTTFGLNEEEDADLKVHIIHTSDTWEIGVEMTPRPLSSRDYKVLNMGGAINPTIAYAMNSLCELEHVNSYLNVFSGSATLLIEAAKRYPNLVRLVGFDNRKESITLAIQNIKKAGLMKRIQLKERDIFDKPDLGKFDVITSDLPFGMLILKNENLEELYRCFVAYCQETLNHGRRLAAYTSEHKLLKKVLVESQFKIIKTLELKLTTSTKTSLYPNIFVCTLK